VVDGVLKNSEREEKFTGEIENSHNVSVGKPEGKRQIRISKCR